MMLTVQETRVFTVEDLWALARVGAPEVRGGLMVVPVTRYEDEAQETLYRIKLPDGTPEAITSDKASASQPALSPDGGRLAFVRKPQGGEKAQLHLMPLDGGEARCLTDAPLGVTDPRWLPDGSGLLFLASVYRHAPGWEETREAMEAGKKSGLSVKVTEDVIYRYWDRWLTDGDVPHIFRYDLADGTITDLTPDFDRWFDLMDPKGQYDVAPDGREITFAANFTPSSAPRARWAVYTLSLEGGSPVCLTFDHPADDLRPRYSPDGRYIVFGCQQEWDFYADRVRLIRYDRAARTFTPLTEDWDLSAGEWEFDEQGSLWVVAEEQGRSSLWKIAVDGTRTRVAQGGTLSQPRPRGDGVYLQRHGLTGPPEIVRVSPDGTLHDVTGFNRDLLSQRTLGRVEERKVGDVQAFVTYPPAFDRSRRWPLLHLIHGGPHNTFGDAFTFRWNAQAFAAAGYVVVQVNFHGSTSFGNDFAKSILGGWGDRPPQDVEAVTDALVGEGWVDEKRMAIAGGSYGGYLTAWLTCRTSRYACAVVHAGVTDFNAQYASDVVQGRAREFGAEPWQDLERAQRYSPHTMVGQVSTPTLVIHGEQDFRVPAAQGLQWYNMLRQRGVPARLVYYPDENHWILKKKNSMYWYSEFLGWLSRWMGGEQGRS